MQKVTQTPQQPSAGGAKALKIVGIVLVALAAALLNVAANDLGYAIQYGEWWYALRQMFYPVDCCPRFVAAGRQRRHEGRCAATPSTWPAPGHGTRPAGAPMKAAEVGEAKRRA